MSLPFQLDKQGLAQFCRRNQIRTLSLFGSVLREDFEAGSDVDMLVEFVPLPRGKRADAYFGLLQRLESKELSSDCGGLPPSVRPGRTSPPIQRLALAMLAVHPLTQRPKGNNMSCRA